MFLWSKFFQGLGTFLLGISAYYAGQRACNFYTYRFAWWIEGFHPQTTRCHLGYFMVSAFKARGLTLRLFRRVGHVRVFAAASSFMSGGVIVFRLVDRALGLGVLRCSWTFLHVGIYVSAESGLNACHTNENFVANVLSVYMICTNIWAQRSAGLLTWVMQDVGSPSSCCPILCRCFFVRPILLSVPSVPVTL